MVRLEYREKQLFRELTFRGAKKKDLKYLQYIHNYWKKVTCFQPKDKRLHFGLPFRYIAPNHDIFYNDQFYWDSYFTIAGLVRAGKINLARGMVNNFVYLFRRFGIIPMRNRYYNLGTSQIPFLTSMAFEIYEAEKNKNWLKKVIKVAEEELNKYWVNEKLTEKHVIYKGLSRYCDHFITHLGAEHESGWDMTSRFQNRCLDFLPVDLNACLYKYETDISRACQLLRRTADAAKYRAKAAKRKRQMNKLMWNEKKGFFMDYDRGKGMQSPFFSVAGFYPLWAGLASKKQAKRIKEKMLPLFEQEGGIVNTLRKGLLKDFRQHDYPNGWPQHQYIVIKGLLNYGYRQDARRVAEKWIGLNKKIFDETGKFWEKYDVVHNVTGAFNPDRYPTQSGFSWTNAVFLWICDEFKMT